MSFERLSITRFIESRSLALQGKGLRLVASHVQALAQDIRARLDIDGPDIPENFNPVRSLMALAIENTPHEMQDLLKPGRKKTEIEHLRHASIWAASKRFGLGIGKIARLVGCDHSSIANSIEQGEALREHSEEFRELTEMLLCAHQSCPHCHHKI